MKLLNSLLKFYINWRGFSTKRKLVIIESDDWGSRRTDNLEVYRQLIKINPLVANDPYTRLDNIANAEDLHALFDVLTSIKDKNGNHPAITANTIMANPDFDKIKASGYKEYFYEPFYKTLAAFPDGAEILNLWKQGQVANIFKPQLHGREHLHALMWLKELQNENKDLLEAFKLENYGIPYVSSFNNKRKNLQAALDTFNIEGEVEFQKKYIKEGAEMFSEHFGYPSLSFIAPAYIWPKWIEKELLKEKVQLLQGLPVQFIPGKKAYKKRMHYIGKQNRFKQYYLHRNAFFEPSILGKRDEQLQEVFKRADTLFNAGKPLIISIHRIQFIGSLSKKNRNENLHSLHNLLSKLQQEHPEIEYLSTDQLYNLLKE